MSPYARIRRAINLTKKVVAFRRTLRKGNYTIYAHDSGHWRLYSVYHRK